MDGIINVYKEKGYTSFDVVAKLRGILKQKKIGHTGTLDPDAEGVLPVCIGKATRLCDLLTEKDKIYEAVIKLGVRTDTQDISGTVTGARPYTGDEDTVIRVVKSFQGEMEQLPPMYSAVRVGGKRLYELARKGITVERSPRNINVYSLDVLETRLKEGTVRIRAHVSKGTYIRTLCEDIGEKLGCDACMYELLRVKSGSFGIKDSIKLDRIQSLVNSGEIKKHVIRIEEVFTMPAVIMKEEADRYVKNGNIISSGMFMEYGGISGDRAFISTGDDDICVYYSDGTFAAVYRKAGARGKTDNTVRYNVYKMF